MGVAAEDAQLTPLHFDRANRMTDAGSHFRIRARLRAFLMRQCR